MPQLLPQSIALAADLLDICPPFTEDSITQAFRKVAFETHPDHGGTNRAFRSIVSAKELLLSYIGGSHEEPKPQKPKKPPKPPKKKRPTNSEPSNWFRAKTGSLCRKCYHCGELITVFKRQNHYNWVHCDEFSRNFFSELACQQNANFIDW